MRRVIPANAPLQERFRTAPPARRLELGASQSRCGAGDPLGTVALARLGAGEDRLQDSRIRLLRRAR